MSRDRVEFGEQAASGFLLFLDPVGFNVEGVFFSAILGVACMFRGPIGIERAGLPFPASFDESAVFRPAGDATSRAEAEANVAEIFVPFEIELGSSPAKASPGPRLLVSGKKAL